MKSEKAPSLYWLKVDDIKIPKGRLRSHFNELLEEFEGSIKAEGVIHPVTIFEDDEGVRWLAYGQNRLEIAIKNGKSIIQAYVLRGSEKDAVLYSAKLNVLRGKVNVGELAEFCLRLHDKDGMTVEKIADGLHFSKGYISQLIAIAQNSEILEKLKMGLISVMEAYNEVKSLIIKPISKEKASFDERGKILEVQEGAEIEESSAKEPTKTKLTDED